MCKSLKRTQVCFCSYRTGAGPRVTIMIIRKKVSATEMMPRTLDNLSKQFHQFNRSHLTFDTLYHLLLSIIFFLNSFPVLHLFDAGSLTGVPVLLVDVAILTPVYLCHHYNGNNHGFCISWLLISLCAHMK